MRNASKLAAQSEKNPEPQSGAEELAYVIYTSGSTGHTERSGSAAAGGAAAGLNTNYVALDQEVRMAQVSNASFDALTFELWGALLHGGQVIGISKEVALSPEEFVAELEQRGVNVLFLTTALFNQLGRSVPRVCGVCVTCCLAVRRWSRSGCGPCWRRAGRKRCCTCMGQRRTRPSAPGRGAGSSGGSADSADRKGA